MSHLLQNIFNAPQARARLELREETTEQDAVDVIDMMKDRLVKLFSHCRCAYQKFYSIYSGENVDFNQSFFHLIPFSLFLRSMIDTQLDGMGFMDFSRSQHGSGMSKIAQVRKMVNLLQERAQLKCSSIFSVQEMKDIARVI